MSRNIVNIDEVETFVTELEDRAFLAAVRGWLRSTYRRWLIKHAPNAVRVIARTAPPSAARLETWDPETGEIGDYFGATHDWLLRALERDEAVWSLRCDAALQRDAWEAMDWLDSLWGSPMFRRIDRISYPQALAAGRERRARLARAEIANEISGDLELIHQFGDGFRVVRLATPRALSDEGARMGHCAGDYARDPRKRNVAILSLRDDRGRPHCTLEIRGTKIVQIKGKQNRPPVARYRPYVHQLIAGLGLGVAHDAENVGLLQVAGRTYADINSYLAAWERAGAPEAWDVDRTDPTVHWVDLVPLRTIYRQRDEMTENSRARLFTMLARTHESGMRFRIVATLDIFGTPFVVVHPDYPYGLYILKYWGVFRDPRQRSEIEKIVASCIGTLLAALDEHPNWIFVTRMLDASRLEDRNIGDVLTVGRIEFRRLRHERQMAMRRRLAALRQANKGLLNDGRVPERRRVRWRDDWRRIQDILEFSAQDVL